MDILALLPPPFLAHLKAVLERTDSQGRCHRVRGAQDWGELAWRSRREPADVLVLDPLVDGTSRVREVMGIVEQQPTLPLVLYTTLSPPALRAVAELARHGVHQVVLHRFDDDAARLREVVEQQPGVKLSEEVLARLATPLARLPVPVQRAVERLFRHPREFEAGELAAAAGVPVRTLYRQLEGAGFASPALVVRGARLLRAYSLLREARATADDVAAKLEYSSRQLFARHVRLAFGTTVAGLRRQVEPAELVARLTAMVWPGPGGLRRVDDTTDDTTDDSAALDDEPDTDAGER